MLNRFPRAFAASLALFGLLVAGACSDSPTSSREIQPKAPRSILTTDSTSTTTTSTTSTDTTTTCTTDPTGLTTCRGGTIGSGG